jgi:antitoxin component YwqK of YwqJK toxin-antitoxin module
MELMEDLRMRFRNLSFLLGLAFAGACTSGRTHRAESVVPPAGAQRSESSGGQVQPVAPQDKQAKAESVIDAESSEPKTVEVIEEKYDGGVVRKRVEGYRNSQGEFVPHGLTSTWYESGLKWTEITFRDGIKHGPQRKWYNTGAEWSNSGYDNGIEHGVWIAYHPNGEKAREMHMDHGVRDGAYIEYHPNGRKSTEVMFVKGMRQGISKAYDEDGSVVMITDYIDGVEQP